MDSRVKVYDIPAIVQGNTFMGLGFSIRRKIGTDYTDLVDDIIEVKMDIRKKANSAKFFYRATLENGISKVATTSPKLILIEKFNVTFPAGEYVYDIAIKFTNGDIRTYQKGTFTVIDSSSVI